MSTYKSTAQKKGHERVLAARAAGKAPLHRERDSRAGQWQNEYEHALALRRLAKSWHLAGSGYDPNMGTGPNIFWIGARPADAVALVENVESLIGSMERLIALL